MENLDPQTIDNVRPEDLPFIKQQFELFQGRIDSLQKGFNELSDQVEETITEMKEVRRVSIAGLE